MKELSIVRQVLNEFERNHLTYCHWKSNEHVQEGMCGITDLDILVAQDQSEQALAILLSYGFKRFVATFGIRYPGIEDFIGLDGSTGKIIHFHMHYQLTLGEKYLKGYHLPWEKVILETRIQDDENQIYISNPNIEMVLLLVRAAFKWRIRDRIFDMMGKKYYRGDFKNEYLWLLQRIHKNQFEQYCRELIGVDNDQLYANLVAPGLTMKDFMKFRKLILKRFAHYKMYANTAAIFWKTTRELLWVFSVFRKKYLRMNNPVRRTLPTGGIVVALIGSDGSGKSTVVKNVVDHFSWKIDATRVYFGSGDGRSSFLRYPMKMVRKLFLKSPLTKAPAHSPGERPAEISIQSKSSILYQGAKLFWALALSIEKKQKIKNVWKYRKLGMVVVTDRYPQTQVKGINDGPLLSHWIDHKNRWLRSVAAKEMLAYQEAEHRAPDLVIRLNVTPEIAASRKHDMTFDDFSKKIEIVKSLSFNTNVVEVDATRPLHEVLVEVKRAIWAKM